MGQAKLRGTFEERKAQAIEEGRIKTPKKPKRQIRDEILSEIMDENDGFPFWPGLFLYKGR